jgi:hypothetical protein
VATFTDPGAPILTAGADGRAALTPRLIATAAD